MKVFGIGTDVVPVDRFERLVRESEAIMLQRLFTPAEAASLSRCLSMERRVRAYAASFAAKESVYKALGTGLIEGMSWRDIEIEDIFGRCQLKTFGRTAEFFAKYEIVQSRISCSSSLQVATAFAMLFTEELSS